MTKARILIVEDEIIVARDLQARLTRLGYTVVGLTGSGDEVLALATETRPDLVLMDICLQGMDGVAVAEQLRSRLQLPVVFVTAHADETTIGRAKVAEPFGYILKPFEERELRVVLEMALYKHRAERKLKESEAHLRQAQKMEAIGQLAAGVAHDFNNLLQVITGYSIMLMATVGKEHHWHGKLEEIFKAGHQAADLTRQLLAFSRQEEVRPKVVDLNVVVTGTEKLLRRLIGEHIDMSLRLDPKPQSVLADPGQLKQILLNLAINAGDAMPGGGTLTVDSATVVFAERFHHGSAALRPGTYCRLRVSDTGCGMDEATQARVFEPYFTTKPLGKGTGLGLATVYGIIEQSGGQITVESALGRGTTFTLYFPAAPVPAAPPPLLLPELPGGTETVLLVEDASAVRGVAREVLQLRGYAVLEAADGIEALEISARHAGRIDVLLTDVLMPRMGGTLLAERLLKERPGVRVLFTSGHPPSVVLMQGRRDDALAFLQKPYTPHSLATAVRAVLDRQES